ncbi:MAG TPA: hypothetical protein VH107_12690 [Lacipirellulaceae bacterium]|jgi:hypothetical protein|nr:hypothetical protein [Lacipirellulaceae bacterium]
MIASAGSAAAAAAQIRAMHEEEESLTTYSPDDLSQGWEFKIIRSNTMAFRKPEVLQQVCDEEAQSGWVLVEKFDDSRLRFKRPVSARNQPGIPGVDPYRTIYGMRPGKLVALILVATFGGIAIFIAIAVAIATAAGRH